MPRTQVLSAVVAILLSAATPTIAACTLERVAGIDRVVPQKGINQTLFGAAVRAETNLRRCKANRRALRSEAGIVKVAHNHSKFMAKKQKLTHKSNVSGQRSLQPRLKAAGIRPKTGAENIGLVHYFRIDEGQTFFPKGNCKFTNSAGAVIPPHTYGSLAKRITDLWMASPVHKKNIMLRKTTMIGTAVAYDPKSKNCGHLYITQDFAG